MVGTGEDNSLFSFRWLTWSRISWTRTTTPFSATCLRPLSPPSTHCSAAPKGYSPKAIRPSPCWNVTRPQRLNSRRRWAPSCGIFCRKIRTTSGAWVATVKKRYRSESVYLTNFALLSGYYRTFEPLSSPGRVLCTLLQLTVMDATLAYLSFRCIKPNEVKRAAVFSSDLVRHQVRYLGLMENVRVRRAGYAFRQKYEDCLTRLVPRHPLVLKKPLENCHCHFLAVLLLNRDGALLQIYSRFEAFRLIATVGHSRVLAPKFFMPRKNCFKHVMKTRIIPPLKCIFLPPQALKPDYEPVDIIFVYLPTSYIYFRVIL